MRNEQRGKKDNPASPPSALVAHGSSLIAPSSLQVEGVLKTWSQEGGYADDALEIDGRDLSELIADHFGDGRTGDRNYGRVRITIERLSPATSDE